jgi:hypothetical protein
MADESAMGSPAFSQIDDVIGRRRRTRNAIRSMFASGSRYEQADHHDAIQHPSDLRELQNNLPLAKKVTIRNAEQNNIGLRAGCACDHDVRALAHFEPEVDHLERPPFARAAHFELCEIDAGRTWPRDALVGESAMPALLRIS